MISKTGKLHETEIDHEAEIVVFVCLVGLECLAGVCGGAGGGIGDLSPFGIFQQ